MENNIAEIIKFITKKSHDSDENTKDTPARVVKSWLKLYGGYNQDPKDILARRFPAKQYDQIVILKDIEMYSTCSHHMLPFFGKAHIGYIPNEEVVGLSKLARLVECFARRFQLQENLTEEIADSINQILNPKGVMVVIEAQHMCMTMRGIEKQNSHMVTSAIRGNFKNTEAREEFLNLIKK